MRTLLVVLIGSCLLALGACGQSEEDKRKEQAVKRQRAEKRKEARAKRKAVAQYNRCKQSLQGLPDALQELSSRLDVGLNFDEYTDKVGDIQVEYDKIDFEALGKDAGCLTSVGLPLEQAGTQFQKAASVWQKCQENIDCDNDSIQPELQEHWSKAGVKIESSKTALEALKAP
jgi:exonuclease VII small subunit